MYPFFDKGGNDNNGDFQLNIRDTQPQINKQLNFLLPFYGFGFNYTWLSLHGYLSFSESPVQVHSVYEKRCKLVTTCSHCLRIDYYFQKLWGLRFQWNSAQMNNRQLKKSKS